MSRIRYFSSLLTLNILFAASVSRHDDINVRLISNYYNKYCVAAGRDLQSIMMWENNPTVSYFEPNLEYLKINCEFGVKESCTQYWISNAENGWKIGNSFQFKLGLLSDRRWEGLTTYPGKEYGWKETFINKQIYKLHNSTNFEIPVSFKSTRDLNMFLCDGSNELTSNCYWIVVAGWEGIQTAHGKIFSEDAWNHITTQKIGKKISVHLQNGLTLLEWEDKSENINVLYSIITLRSSGRFKVHDYNVIYTENQQVMQMGNFSTYFRQEKDTFCIAMFIRMCKKCKMVLFLKDTYFDKYLSENRTFSTNEQWEEIYFSVNIQHQRNNVYTAFHIKTEMGRNVRNPFWAIGEFRACSSKDIRFIHHAESNQKKCVIVKPNEPDEIIEIDTTTATESGEAQRCKDYSLKIGDTCYPFSKFSNVGSRICYFDQRQKRSICYCNPGYTGQYCSSDCERTYGYDCEETCGRCDYGFLKSFRCDNVNGYCKSGCEDGFTGSTCKISKYPVLVEAPQIIEVDYYSIKLKLSSNTYVGREIPKAYTFLYRNKHSSEWSGTNQFKWNDFNEKTIENLKPSTSYEIITALIASDGKSNVENALTYEVFTKCDDLNRENIMIHSITNVSVTLFVHIKEQNCNLSLYEITMKGESISFSNNTYSKTDLEPYSQYEIFFKRDEVIFIFDFQTKEGIPGDVLELKVETATNSSLSIVWIEPEHPNGEIENYNIQYKLLRNIECGEETRYSEIITQTSRSTFYTIENLRPHSVYEVGVSAITKVGEGKSMIKNFRTNSADYLLENEITELKIEAKSQEASLMVIKDCSNSGGEIDYHMRIHCSDPWCGSPFDAIYNNSENVLSIENLIPYSNYTVDIQMYRHNIEIMIDYTQKNFQTTSGIPNRVMNLSDYSKTNSSVSLKWRPSFPPNGIVEKFHISIQKLIVHTQTFTDPIFHIIDPGKCKIWDDFYCFTLTNLTSDEIYAFTISVKNLMVDGYSKESDYIYVKPELEAPQPPKYPTITFDDDNNLICSWKHPDKINGPLTQILITLKNNIYNILYNASYIDDFETLNFVKKINRPENGWNTDIVLAGFQACNSFACSDTVHVDITLPPKLPSFHGDVSIETTETSANIILPKSNNYKNIYVLISHSNLRPIVDDFVEKLYQKCNISLMQNQWLLAKFEDVKKTKLAIGKDVNDSDIQIDIKPNTEFEVCIVLSNGNANNQRLSAQKVKFTSTTPVLPEKSTDTNYGLLALLFLLLLPAVGIWIYVRRKNKTPVFPFMNKTSEGSSPDVIPLSTRQTTKSNQRTRVLDKLKIPSTNVNKLHSKPIKLANFEQYVKEAMATGELKRQHDLFPRGQMKPWDYGNLPANKAKNRYNNLVAYNHSRVILEKIDGDNYSDYINASYIMGYNDIPKAYIATQGPKISTVNDFWRMIWQEKVNHIVMLANVVENGKKKTEQYWPNMNETRDFGPISVAFVSSKVFADYEYRQFIIRKDGVERNVQQLHFTSWPDHGVPLYTQSLVPFLQKMLTIPQGNSPPIVVHCSAGVGRTGTIILSDICLRMAAREALVDVLWYLKQLRDQRPNMVDNIEQYKLIHMMLLECLFAPTTCVLCDNTFESKVEKICAEDIDSQMQYLKDTMWQDQMLKSMLSKDANIPPEYPTKNRFNDIVPDKYGLIYITRYPHDDESSSYINAIKVDGFRVPNKFIATQQPLPNTICDFWRLVNDKQSTVIVSLNEIKEGDKSCQSFWPTEDNPEMYPVPFIRLEYVKCDNTEIYMSMTINLHLQQSNETETRSIQLILFNNWSSMSLLPNKQENLITLCEEVERISRSGGPIIVTCYNGATACGLFTAANFLIEKIKLEQQCDVCLAVRVVRHNRPQFIIDKRQFIYLYELALEYIRGFETYSNFA